MENILKKLSDYQIEAYKRGISFSIDLYGAGDESEIDVNVHHNAYDKEHNCSSSIAFNATFTPETNKTTITRNLDKIDKYIQSITTD